MYVGKKGPVFELISCLRDARSNGKETISLFKYPIHVYVHFCPTWDGCDRGSATAPAPARCRRGARLRLVEVVPGRGLGRQTPGGGSKLRGERPRGDPVNFSHLARKIMFSGKAGPNAT